MKKIELLSPAGDLERLKTAYLYGADACYIGGTSYSLRANANNFTIDEIKEARKIASKLKKKLYVTVNISFHNDDLEGIEKYLKELDKIKIDAVIISDPLLIPIIKKNCKHLEIHLSTQESTTNYLSVKYWLKEGATRVVLAREVSKDEIKEIYNKTKAQLEVFLHGAMCTCISGRCVLSNYFTNRDSNRGGCAQVCRFNFDLDKKRKTDFQIATCDLNLSNYIKDLIEANVASLKVEGRMRSTYYIATVISSYRKLIDAYYNNTMTKELLKSINKSLGRVANRISTSHFFDKKANYKDQYYLGRNEISNQDFLAQVIDYDKKNKLVIVEQRNYFKKGDTVNIFGPSGFEKDLKIEKIYNENMEEVEIANHPKEILKIKADYFIPNNSMMRVKF